MRGIAYREDLRFKYDIPEITNNDMWEDYLKTVMENVPEITYGWDAYNGFFTETFSTFYSGQHDNVYPVSIIGAEAPFYVGVSEDGKTVTGAVVMGDTQENFDKMPEDYQYDFIKEYHLDRLRWAPYLSPTRGTTDAATGYAAGTYNVVSTMPQTKRDISNDAQLLEIWPDASYRLYITEEDQRNFVEGAMVNEMKSNNFLVVPAWSENIEATMLFLDWMFGSKENHDLFQYGVEGVHWEAVGDDAFKILESGEADRYIMNGYSFTWNPNYIRYTEEVMADEELKAMFDYQNSAEAYTVSAISGFTFNPENVTTEVAIISALSNELMLRFAVDGDGTEEVIDQWYADAVGAGLDDVREELISQLQAFLDMKNQ
jgi:putative aldouronate transport system substrate-binding protein